MLDDGLEQPFAQPLPAVRFEDEHVAQPAKGCVVGHHPGKANLLLAVIHAKAERVQDGVFDHFAGAPLSPIGAVGQITMNDIKLQTPRIRIDREAFTLHAKIVLHNALLQ